MDSLISPGNGHNLITKCKLCKFSNQCEFAHHNLVKQIKDDSEQKMGEVTINDDNVVDYDNIDSDDDSDDEIDTKKTVTHVNIHAIWKVTLKNI